MLEILAHSEQNPDNLAPLLNLISTNPSSFQLWRYLQLRDTYRRGQFTDQPNNHPLQQALERLEDWAQIVLPQPKVKMEIWPY